MRNPGQVEIVGWALPTLLLTVGSAHPTISKSENILLRTGFGINPVFNPNLPSHKQIAPLGKLKQNAIKLQSPLANFLGGLEIGSSTIPTAR
jgi:hypothetical protein